MTPVPLQKFYDLSALSQGGDEIVLTAKDSERAALAEFAGVEEVKTFEARVTLKRPAPNRFLIGYALRADIVQACVVTLDPVPAQIAVEFERELKLAHTRQRRAVASEDFEISESQDDGPEDIESPNYDLAGPVLEEFILALDPYPRAPGAELELPQDQVPARDNPFAVLKNLKKQGP